MPDDEEVRKHMERFWAQRQDYVNQREAFRLLYGREPATPQELDNARALEVDGIRAIRGIPSAEAFGSGGAVSLGAQPRTATITGPAEPEAADFDFSTEAGRNHAVIAYTTYWLCSEAALARTANVHPSDLSKWKKGSLRSTRSAKAKRIESALKNNAKPTPAAKHSTNY